MKTKKLMAAVAVALTLCVTIGGTLAWLTDKTESKVNTFTVGNIDIDLGETTSDYKMVPGNTIAKDPKVTVKKNSEACWLFVKVEESSNLDDFITYTVPVAADKWVQLVDASGNDVDGVYYREVPASTNDQVFDVLAGNKVTVKESVTKAMMDALNMAGATQPSLTFTAYAVQKAHFATPAAAWAEASK